MKQLILMEQEQDYLYVESVKAIKEGEIDPSNWNSEELIQFLKQNNIKKSLNAFGIFIVLFKEF